MGGILSGPPQSCLKIVDEVHSLYNAGNFARIFEMTDAEFRDGTSPEQWIEQWVRLREQAGRFVRVRFMGHMISVRSLTTIAVELWATSDFENGPKHERIQCVTGLFRPARLAGFGINDVPPKPPQRQR